MSRSWLLLPAVVTPSLNPHLPHPQVFWRACRAYIDSWDSEKVRAKQAARAGEAEAAQQAQREAEGPSLAEEFGAPPLRCCLPRV